MKQFRNTLSLFILFIYVSFSFTIDSEVQEVKTQEFVVIDSVLIDDCIFDTKTQNEEFLKGIEELSGWNWIDGLHTAFIPLENGDTIEINKGGCIHYNYYVRLHSYSDSTSVRQTNYWKNEILKITRLLSDFETNMADSLIVNGGYEVESNHFEQQYFILQQELYCSMTFFIERRNGKVIVELGYYLC